MTLFDQHFRTRYRKAVKAARAEKVRCVRLRDGLYYVARKADGHGEYLVSVSSTRSGMFATCRTIRGAACPSYGVCIHLAKTYDKMITEGMQISRKERTEAA